MRVHAPDPVRACAETLPAPVLSKLVWSAAPAAPDCAVVPVEGGPDRIRAALEATAERPAAIVPVFAATTEGLAAGGEDYPLDGLFGERSVSIDTTAAGGNASLMAMA